MLLHLYKYLSITYVLLHMNFYKGLKYLVGWNDYTEKYEVFGNQSYIYWLYKTWKY